MAISIDLGMRKRIEVNKLNPHKKSLAIGDELQFSFVLKVGESLPMPSCFPGLVGRLDFSVWISLDYRGL
jgi:hypothetical protein